MAFDRFGREYMIDVFTHAGEINRAHEAGTGRSGLSSYRTQAGHTVTYLGGGEFSVLVPGEEEPVTLNTDDPDFA